LHGGIRVFTLGSTVVREATVDDIPRLVEMGERFLTETIYRGRAPVNPLQMAETAARLLTSEAGALFVSDDDGAVVGMIGVLFFQNPLTGEPSVTELFWWVEPEHRGHGLRLLKRAEEWSREAGAHKLHMIAPTPEIARLYERLGFDYLESAYQKAIA